MTPLRTQSHRFELNSRDTAQQRQHGVSSSRHTFLYFQALHIVVFTCFVHWNLPETIAASGLVNMLLYAFLLRDEFRRSNWPVTPLLMYCISSFLRLGVASVYLAIAYILGYGREMWFVRFCPDDYLSHAHVLLLIGDWALIAGYSCVDSRSPAWRQLIVRPTSHDAQKIVKLGLSLIVMSWFVRWGNSALHLDQFGRLTSVFAKSAFPAGLLLALVGLAQWQARRTVVLLVALLFLIQIALSLRTYMKTETIRVALPLLIFFLDGMRLKHKSLRMSWRHAVPLFLISYFLVMILFPYNQIRRRAFDMGSDGLPTGNVRIVPFLWSATLGSIPCTEEFAEIHTFPDQGLWSFFNRNEFTTLTAWAVSEVAANGPRGCRGLQSAFPALIPRLVWPNKPMIAPGRELAVILGQANSFESATTSTSLGLAGALYWDGGIFIMLVGMFVNGALVAITWHAIRKNILVNPGRNDHIFRTAL